MLTRGSFFLNKLLNFMGVGLSLYGLAALYQYFSKDPIIKHTVKCRYCRKRINEKVSVRARGGEARSDAHRLCVASIAAAGRTAGRTGLGVNEWTALALGKACSQYDRIARVPRWISVYKRVSLMCTKPDPCHASPRNPKIRMASPTRDIAPVTMAFWVMRGAPAVVGAAS